jgi:hypothetical protein
MIPHTKFEELEISFKENAPDVKLLSMYPGEFFDFFSNSHEINSITRVEMAKDFIPEVVSSKIQLDDDFTERVESQMFILQQKGEAFGVENVIFKISSSGRFYEKNFRFSSAESRNGPIITITVKVPDSILYLFSINETNWDHIAIGYWGEWTREPDVYPANFMRLLQSGQEQSILNEGKNSAFAVSSLLRITIGDIIEKDPDRIVKILSRLGLPCISCIRTNSETIGQALEIHQIDIVANLWLLREMAAIWTTEKQI